MATLERNQAVVFKWQGRWYKDAKVLRVYPEHNGVVRVEDSRGLDYVLLPEEVRTVKEHEAVLAEAQREKDAVEYADIVQAWQAGIRKLPDLAKATNTPTQGIASRVRAAKRKGLIE